MAEVVQGEKVSRSRRLAWLSSILQKAETENVDPMAKDVKDEKVLLEVPKRGVKRRSLEPPPGVPKPLQVNNVLLYF